MRTPESPIIFTTNPPTPTQTSTISTQTSPASAKTPDVIYTLDKYIEHRQQIAKKNAELLLERNIQSRQKIVNNWIKKKGSKKAKVTYKENEIVFTKKKINKKIVKRNRIIIQINLRKLVKKNSYTLNQEDLTNEDVEKQILLNNNNSKQVYKIIFSDRTTS